MRTIISAFIIVLLLSAGFAHASTPEKTEENPLKHHFLTIGGGYSPTGNQVSLEKNILYLQRMLKDLDFADAPHTIYFADGNDPGRDLQFMDPKFRIPKINKILAGLAGSTKGLANQYRTNVIKANGASKADLVSKWFDQKGKKLTKEDRLMLYFTGHGGKGDKKKPFNTVMYLWQDKNFRVAEFVKELDKLDKALPVTIVMVQCYSGGFANIIFKEGDTSKGLSDHTRAGFYSTTHTRVAAGCTPDIREQNYREYSTYFWEALYGQTRLGKKVKKPDYDKDGKTTYAEAHAYTIIRSTTIDIPVKTSDAFLRHFSKTKQPAKGEKVEGLLTPETDFDTLLKAAGKCEKAVLRSLSKKLELKGKNRAGETRELIKKIDAEKKKLNDEKNKLNGERNKIKSVLSKLIKKDWPELSNAYHPTVRKLLRKDEAEKIIKLVEGHKDHKRFDELGGKIQGLSTKVTDQDRKWVKCHRLLRTLENVALEANLPKFAKPDIVERYEELLAAEGDTL